MSNKVIKTSDKKWVEKLAKAYKDKIPFKLINDAGLNIDPQIDSIRHMGKEAGLSNREFSAVLVALGMSAFGVGLVIAGVMSPEPNSKLWLMIGGGSFIAATGGWGAMRILTGLRPPNVRARTSENGPAFEISWD